MGATEFFISAGGEGVSVGDAFHEARDQAAYDHGHAGYTGTIAEKDSYVYLHCPQGMTPREFAGAIAMMDNGMIEIEPLTKDQQEAVDKAIPYYNDKWGPALAVALGNGKYLFFGIASS
jgi:hypothetical protein